MTVAAIIVAAGRGSRAGGDVPKQYQEIGGEPVLQHTLRALARHPAVADLVLVIHPDDRPRLDALAPLPDRIGLRVVSGGDSRDASVRAGLAALPAGATRVLIHDAARPFVTAAVIDRVLAALDTADGAAPALAVTDALWRGEAGRVVGTRDRAGLYRAQTPRASAAPRSWPPMPPIPVAHWTMSRSPAPMALTSPSSTGMRTTSRSPCPATSPAPRSSSPSGRTPSWTSASATVSTSTPSPPATP